MNNLQSLLYDLKSTGLSKEDIIKAVNDIYSTKECILNVKNSKSYDSSIISSFLDSH